MSSSQPRRSSSLFGVRTWVGPVTKRVPALHRALVAAYHLGLLEVRPRLARLVRGDWRSGGPRCGCAGQTRRISIRYWAVHTEIEPCWQVYFAGSSEGTNLSE